MKAFLSAPLICLFLLASLTGTSQSVDDIEYDIDVGLDDVSHRLDGNIKISFFNSGADTLHEICILLYPNAYSSGRSAFAQQQLMNGELDFHFADDSRRGYIGNLDFTVNGLACYHRVPEDTLDIAFVKCQEPVLPGQQVTIETPFVVKIPDLFSRLGHDDQAYYISQWYPKLAMYSDAGWCAYPYLDIGEFFSPFARFDVTITLPSNYIVAGTGRLTTRPEQIWLDSLATAKNEPLEGFPRSSSKLKILEFVADSVHDFAWFADKRYGVRKEVIEAGERDVSCFVLFNAWQKDIWGNATDYVARAVSFYSDNVGPYPYPHMTVVEGPEYLQGGMEYPMITLVGGDMDPVQLDQLIAHEVGHNWFYGILASDERKYPWMDEGVNTYFEDRYMSAFYGDYEDQLIPDLFRREGGLTDAQLVWQDMSRRGRLYSPLTDPADHPAISYFIGAYFRPALAFRFLESYMGKEPIDNAFRKYYRQWSFDHPSPADLRAVLENECACDLSWLFDDLLNNNSKINYGVRKYHADRGVLEVKNKGRNSIPWQLAATVDDSLNLVRWYPAFRSDTAVAFRFDSAGTIDLYKPDINPDFNCVDNRVFVGGSRAKTRKWKFGLPGKNTLPGERYIALFPALGGNKYDGFLVGANISNFSFPRPQFNWSLTPMFATQSKSLVGMASAGYRYVIDFGALHHIDINAGIKSFHYNEDEHYGFTDRYLKISPEIIFGLGSDDVAPYITHDIALRFVHVKQDYGRGIDFDNKIWQQEKRSYYVNELRYTLAGHHVLRPFNTTFSMAQGKGFVRLSLDIDQKFIYNSRKKAFHLHFFGGWLPEFSSPDANVNFYYNGIYSNGFFSKDFAYDELLFGRNESTGILSQQVFTKDAQLKTLYNGGVSSEWMAGIGLAVDLPFPVPLRPYIDVALSPRFTGGDLRADYSAGIALIIMDEAVEIYFPLFESEDIRNSLTYEERPGYFQRVTFLFDLTAFNLNRQVDRLFTRK